MNPTGRKPLADFMEDEDVQDMLAFQRGDDEAFSRLVLRHTDGMLNYFWFQSRDHDLAEDCCQEVWAKVFRSREDYSPRARFSTWLYRVCRNHWIDRFRSRARRPSRSSLDGDDEDGGLGMLEGLASTGKGPEESLRREDLARTLARALSKLGPDMREVYILSELEELPYAEIAEILEIPLGTVKSRMFNAVRKLQQVLAGSDEDGVPPA